MSKQRQVWSAEALCTLMQKSHMTAQDLADATGIPASMIDQLMHDNPVPTLEIACQIADYYAVPLDLLVGRCDERTASLILTDYEQHFLTLQRAAYERYLSAHSTQANPTPSRQPDRSKPSETAPEQIAPWPYNLLDDIFEEPVRFPLTKDELHRFDMLLQDLPAKDRDILDTYYRNIPCRSTRMMDQEQLQRASFWVVRKLRHPSYTLLLRYGEDLIERNRAVILKDAQLKVLERELNRRESVLQDRQESMQQNAATSHRQDGAMSKQEQIDNVVRSVNVLVEELPLSTRAYNVLRRNNVTDLAGIVAVITDGRLATFKNLGKILYQEIVSVTEAHTHLHYNEEYHNFELPSESPA